MTNQIMWAVVFGLHVAAAMAAGGCRPPLGVVCGAGWCSDEEICVDPQAAQPVCARGTCGNGRMDLGEECDDGNNTGGDGCSPNCRVEGCGNGILELGEQCDDGNTMGGDGCSAGCTIELCGNSILDREAGEQCDDGNTIEGDGCTASCRLPSCGNGVPDPYEECDDGNTIDGDGCSANCTNEVCGNGILDRGAGEECDDGNTIDHDGCTSSCKLPSCGNGAVDPYEQCDDGNTIDGDGCSASCTIEVCGNGILDRAAGERCDDGNTIDGDGCEANCRLPSCGNGILDPQEQCDDGDTIDGDGCSANCIREVCGNGILDPHEQCDDGNTIDGDGCSANCTFEHSGNGIGLLAYIKASNTDAGDNFGGGAGVALSADGSTLAVGANGEFSAATGIDGNEADNSAIFAGAVYVFTRSGTTWSQQAYIKASNTDAGDNFGWSVALSADGSTLAVGARLESSAATGIGGNQADNSARNAGAVYVFTRSGATWSQQAYIKASNTGSSDQFGDSVALSTDGSTLVVSAVFESSTATGIGGNQADDSANSAGAVYVFTRSGCDISLMAITETSASRSPKTIDGDRGSDGDGDGLFTCRFLAPRACALKDLLT